MEEGIKIFVGGVNAGPGGFEFELFRCGQCSSACWRGHDAHCGINGPVGQLFGGVAMPIEPIGNI